ncbi:CPBP family intramembrane glutamic endopeptidase [Furfurilactobacillus curtus]|uniref:CAAX amino protease n=1 Tax=Furfurilactobacillus curtus TaxID=1746200 RepID=A0ABQ5JP81_9LACO
MADRMRRYLSGVGAMLGLYLLEQLAIAPTYLPTLLKLSSWPAQLGIWIITTVLCGLVFWLLWRLYQHGLAHRQPSYFRPRPTRPRQWLIFALMLVVLSALIISQELIHTSSSENQKAVEQLFNGTPWLTSYLAVFIGPVLEEMIFRGLFFNYFFMKLTTPWVKVLGVVINGLLFAQIHTSLWSPGAWVYFATGMILATTYLETKDIRYDISLHVLSNAFSTLSMLF